MAEASQNTHIISMRLENLECVGELVVTTRLKRKPTVELVFFDVFILARNATTVREVHKAHALRCIRGG